MKGAQRNHARAQTVTENIKIFFFSIQTRSAVHVVKIDSPVDVAIFMAIEGIISKATTWVSWTEKS